MSTLTGLIAPGLWLVILGGPAQIPPPVDGPARSPELRSLRDEILAGERVRLRALADRLRADGKSAEADAVASASSETSRPDGSSRFVPLPEVVAPKEHVGQEIGRFGLEPIRLEIARALFDLAVRASKPPESFALADACLRGVIERQPDHAEARRLLGFIPHEGGWATPYAARKLAEGCVVDPTYGWVDRDWVPHLGRGELPDRAKRRWLPAAEADALRRDWSTKWEIPTEHFRISTNVPLNEAISFARKLEDLHELFFALMADLIDPSRLPLAQRFQRSDLKATAPSPKNAHQVYYFATRDEYAQYLAPIQGEGAKTSLGTYVPKKESPKRFGGISYFFDDAGGELDVTSTLYHEASHQLLFESAGPDDFSPMVSQYWVFEGLGTYFETLKHEADGTLRIGGLVGPRVAQARLRLIDRREFIPIEKFVKLNREQFQGDRGVGDIYLNYAQAMALALFLMQGDGGRHREAFLEYARDVYKGRYRGHPTRSLEGEIGVRYPDLNRALLAYLGRADPP